MPVEITMPRLSDTMEQGTVVKWHIKEGDSVSAGDVIADIETDKATMEQQAFEDGTLAKIVAEEGKEVPVGALIAIIAEAGEDPAEAANAAGLPGAAGSSDAESTRAASEGGSEQASDGSTAASATAEPPVAGSSNGEAAAAAPTPDDAGGRIFASPLARKIAAERGINLAQIQGSGPSGRIVKKDVESFQGPPAAANGQAAQPAQPDAQSAARGGPRQQTAAPFPAPLPAPDAAREARAVPLNNMRATIARRLVESKTTIPHYQVSVSARLDKLSALRTQLNEQLAPQGVKLSVNDFLVRASALAMHQHPYVNSSWDPGSGSGGPSIRLHGRVNVGVAVALPEERGGGLVVATIRDADRRGLRDISAETKRLAKKARDKGLSVEEMSDSTFTISNLGMFGVDHFTAIINPPNAAIMAVGRAIEKVYVTRDDDGDPAFDVGTEMTMTLSSDHRIIDGAMAAQYLGTVKELLESPAALLV